jgi:hypothetical protein
MESDEQALRQEERALKQKYQYDQLRSEYELKMKLKMLHRTGQLTYPNQKLAAQQVIEHYINGKYLVLIVAQPGAGKTGVVLEVTYQLATHPDDRYWINSDNVYMVSGMSDTDWQTQFRDRMLQPFQKNVYHRGNVKKIADTLSLVENGMIVTDECHIASGKKMQLSTLLRGTGLTNVAVAQQRNMKLLEVSATPETIKHDIESWGNKAAVVWLEPGPSYKGFQVMLNENRIREAILSSYEDVGEWVAMFDTRYQRKKYFPVRLNERTKQSEELREWFEIAITEFGWKKIIHNAQDRIDDIDTLMADEPDFHTIIFIKGFWRASKRLNRIHVGGCYEEIPETRNTTSASQGLVARFCDNYEYAGDELNPELRPIYFGDIASIKEYLAFIENGGDYMTSSYTSSRIRSNGAGRVRSTASRVHHTNMTGIEVVHANNNSPAAYEVSDEFNNQRDAERWAITNILFNIHADLIGKNKPTKVTATDASGGTSAKTHMSSRGNRGHSREPIVSRTQLIASGDLSRWGNGVRCVPVKSTTEQNKFVVIYKSDWKRPVSEL